MFFFYGEELVENEVQERWGILLITIYTSDSVLLFNFVSLK